MRLQQLKIADFRNIAQAQIELDPNFNAIAGANGAGKTSVLEAVYTLGHGRSFRSRLAQPLIRQGATDLTVFARCLAQDQSQVKLGISKGGQKSTSIHINGEAASSMAELARLFPVIEVDAASLSLIDEGPAQRRSYLDWGVFHVEHCPNTLWTRFRRVLQQRNSLLKGSGTKDWEFWDNEFVDLCSQIDRARRSYLEKLQPRLDESLELLMESGSGQIRLEYFPGWNEEKGTLKDSLSRNRAREQVLGRTLSGAHCADLRFTIEGDLAKDRFSRGQKKLFVAALKFAQVKLYNDRCSERAVLLLDDFAAELDSGGVKKVQTALGSLNCQIIAAAVDATEIAKLNPYPDSSVFHVEHGKINRLMESVQSG